MLKVMHRFTNKDYITSVPETRVKFKDIFHVKNLYSDMHLWLIEEGYAPVSDPNFKEIFYHHRWTQTAGEEIRWWWRLEKIPEDNTYYKYEIDVNVLVINMKGTEVIFHGKKFKAHTGEPEIKVYGRVIADYQDTWKTHWLLKYLHPLFYKRIFFKDLDMHRRELHRDVSRFMEMLKTHFQLKKYLPEPEGEQFYANREFQ